jgi:formylglycine-generating enzyme
MGSDWHYPEEAPSHDVTVDGFWIDKYAVTNEQFARFVEATGYVTLAERPPKPEDYPGAKPVRLMPASMQPSSGILARLEANSWSRTRPRHFSIAFVATRAFPAKTRRGMIISAETG